MQRLFSIIFATLVLVSCQSKPSYITVDGVMLGTTFHIVARTTLSPSAIYDEVMTIDAEAKSSMSIFDEKSLLSRINTNQTDTLDVNLLRTIAVAASTYHISDGYYDITVKPLTDAYGFAAKKRAEHPNIDSLLEFVGFEKFRINGRRIVKQDERLQLDLNSIAKGYTVDLVADRLEMLAVTDYIVEVGGEIRCKGVNAKGIAWRVGIDSPFDGNNSPGEHQQQIIPLTDLALATSGNYRRYFIDSEGKKVSHTINSRTGKSNQSRLLSATVIAKRCIEADAFATMFMALGNEKAIEKAEQLSDKIQVYFILDKSAEQTSNGDLQSSDYEIFTTIEQLKNKQ